MGIPNFDDSDLEDDEDQSEAAALTRSIAASYHPSMFTNLSSPIKMDGRTLSFGVPEQPHTTLEKLKGGKNLHKPSPLKRMDLSFCEQVELNHVHSFKHELSEREQEEVWYTDVEMVIMKVDCGLFNQAAKNSGQKQQELVNQQRRDQMAKADPNKQRMNKKKDDAKAKAMRKKCGIDKKVTDSKKGTTDSTASAKSKKKGLFKFGKKKK